MYRHTHTVLYHRRCVLAISIHMYTYTWFCRFRDRWYQAAHHPSLGTGIRISTLSRYKRHNMNPRARCNVNGRGKWRWGCPYQLMSSLVGFIFQWFSNHQYLTSDELKDVFIRFYTTEKTKITFGIREHEANQHVQVWRISSWMVYFLPSPVEFPRNARRFWGQCRWASRLGRQDFWHGVGCIIDSAGHVEILGSSRGLPWFHRPWPDVWWLVEVSMFGRCYACHMSSNFGGGFSWY